MGLVGVQENGNGAGNGLSDIALATKNRYQRMDSDITEEEEGLSSRREDTKKYVLVCAVFASLNSVLLGYGR